MSKVLKALSVYDLALLKAWTNQNTGTNWFFYVDDENTNTEDDIGHVVNKAVKGSVHMTKFYIGNVIEFSPRYLKLYNKTQSEPDGEEVLRGILSKLKDENSQGTFIIAWSTNHEPYLRNNEKIDRYCGSLSKHRDILDEYGYYFNAKDCVVLESMDGVLVPILNKVVSEEDSNIDADEIFKKLQDAKQQADETTISL